jgi:hypothetical protein
MSRLACLLLLLPACGGGLPDAPDADVGEPADAAPPDAVPLPAEIDPTFGDHGFTIVGEDIGLTALTRDAQGRLLATGTHYNNSGVAFLTLCRFLGDGDPDPAWSDGSCPRFVTGGHGGVLVSTPGGVIVGGDAGGVPTLWRFDDAPAIDPSYAPASPASGFLTTLFADGDGVITTTGPTIQRLDADGNVVDSATTAADTIYEAERRPDGGLLVSWGNSVLAYDANLDGPVNHDLPGTPHDLAFLDDGSLLASGFGWLGKLLPDGSPDLGFGDGGVVNAPFQEGCAEPCEMWLRVVPLADGRIAVAGARSARRPGGSVYEPIVRVYSATGVLDTDFGYQGLLIVSPPGTYPDRFVVGAELDGTGLVVMARHLGENIGGELLARVLID